MVFFYYLYCIVNLKTRKMIRKIYLLGLLLLPAFVYAQGLDRCATFVPLPKELNDNFLSQETILKNAESEVKKDQEFSKAIHKMYQGCENQSPYNGLLKQVDDALQAAETNKKNAADAFAKTDGQVRQIIADANGVQVACLYIDPNSGELGTVVTVRYYLQDGKVRTMTKTDPVTSVAR
jgi:hypothetical protein